MNMIKFQHVKIKKKGKKNGSPCGHIFSFHLGKYLGVNGCNF